VHHAVVVPSTSGGDECHTIPLHATATLASSRIARLTLFPPTGQRICMTIKDNYSTRLPGILAFTDADGTHYHTTLPWALEHIEEGHQKTPFHLNDETRFFQARRG
jgi:hypothetical protein